MRITRKWKNILSIGLAVLVLFGAVGAVAAFVTNDTKTIGFGEFEIGSLNEVDGQYKEDKTAIYTKDAFECQGLKVKPEFDSDVTYQIFWYNEDELFISCTEKTTSTAAQYVGGVPALAKYARIVIFPSQYNEDGKLIKDFKVGLFDIAKIANNLNITINREQNYEAENLFDGLKVYTDSMGTKAEVLMSGDRVLIENHLFNDHTANLSQGSIGMVEGNYMIKLEAGNVAIYKYDLTAASSDSFVYFYTSEGEFIDRIYCKAGELKFVEVPNVNDNVIIIIDKEDFTTDVSFSAYMPR